MNLAAAPASTCGHRVLLIDLDPQGPVATPNYIKSSVRFHEAPNERTPLVLLHPDVDGAKAYTKIAKEIADARA